MGTFGIFAIVVTIILAGYYVVVITLDLKQNVTKDKAEDVEVIKTTSQEEVADDEEQPVEVEEEGFPQGSQLTASEQLQESLPPGAEHIASVEEIEQTDSKELYKKIQHSKEGMITCKAAAEKEVSSDEYRQSMLEQMEESEKLVEDFENLEGMSI